MNLESKIKIAIADDHKIFRNGIKMALLVKENIDIIWEAEDGKEMMEKLEAESPAVLLMDIRMPEIDGIKAIELIREKNEEIKIIILTMFDDSVMISKMMAMGANAYLTKTSEPDEIYNAILACFKDEYYFNDLVNDTVLNKLVKKQTLKQDYKSDPAELFNKNEITILNLMAKDRSTAEISEELHLSPRTIESFRQSMKNKADVKTLNGLIMFGIQHGLIEQ